MDANKNLSVSFEGYKKTLKKYGYSLSDVDALDTLLSSGEYVMNVTVQELVKRPTYKSFSGAAETIRKEKCNAEYYFNCITSIPFFKDHYTRSCTYAGNIITKLICYNPDKTKKVVRTFELIKK